MNINRGWCRYVQRRWCRGSDGCRRDSYCGCGDKQGGSGGWLQYHARQRSLVYDRVVSDDGFVVCILVCYDRIVTLIVLVEINTAECFVVVLKDYSIGRVTARHCEFFSSGRRCDQKCKSDNNYGGFHFNINTYSRSMRSHISLCDTNLVSASRLYICCLSFSLYLLDVSSPRRFSVSISSLRLAMRLLESVK